MKANFGKKIKKKKNSNDFDLGLFLSQLFLLFAIAIFSVICALFIWYTLAILRYA